MFVARNPVEGKEISRGARRTLIGYQDGLSSRRPMKPGSLGHPPAPMPMMIRASTPPMTWTSRVGLFTHLQLEPGPMPVPGRPDRVPDTGRGMVA